MSYRINILETAENDIMDIYNFVLNNSESKNIANKIFYELYSRMNSLNFMPEIYQVYILDYRTINHKWYKIFYKIDEKGEEVFIYHILSQKQNYINYLS